MDEISDQQKIVIAEAQTTFFDLQNKFRVFTVNI